MIQEKYMDFNCAAGLVKQRFVTITPATDSVAYCSAGAQADGITIGDESNLKISVLLLNNLYASWWVDCAATVTKGDDLEVGADGKAQTLAAGTKVGVAKTAGSTTAPCVGYNAD